MTIRTTLCHIINKIPCEEMRADDQAWVPLMLNGKNFEADFFFNKENDKITKYVVRFHGN